MTKPFRRLYSSIFHAMCGEKAVIKMVMRAQSMSVIPNWVILIAMTLFHPIPWSRHSTKEKASDFIGGES